MNDSEADETTVEELAGEEFLEEKADDDLTLEQEMAVDVEIDRLRSKGPKRRLDGAIRGASLKNEGKRKVMSRLRAENWDLAYDRPVNRSECKSGPRPCPFVGCRHHLYLDVNPDSGTIKLNFPHLEVWQLAQTCALDIADREGVTLEETGSFVNLTRERVRQIEVRGLVNVRDELRRRDKNAA